MHGSRNDKIAGIYDIRGLLAELRANDGQATAAWVYEWSVPGVSRGIPIRRD